MTSFPASSQAAGQHEFVDPSGPEVTLSQHFETTVPAGPSPPPPPSFRALHSLSVQDDVWRYYRDLSIEAMRQMDPTDQQHKAVPLPYCNAYCLDTQLRGRSSFGYPSATFQVTSREDGNLYCLKRFDSVRSVSPRIALAVSDQWKHNGPVQEHPGIVPFYQCFVAQRAVFFVHQYIPGARSLGERIARQQPFSEPILWSIIAQLVSAIRIIHGNNLACHTLHLQHVLSNTDASNTRLRVRIGSLGIVDTLEFEARKPVKDSQMDDMRDLGRLILSLASGTEVNANVEASAMQRYEQFLLQNFSRELHSLTMTLIRSGPRPPSILDVSRVVAYRCFDEQDAAYCSMDRMERALTAEYESGRVFRLLLKLGFINERPEFGPNRRWAQSGDCYVLTLFRDYVFHQADGAGNPVLDLGHVVTALNKLDVADEEQIALTSRDGKTVMVVSYAEVARCLESAYHELCAGSVPPSMLQY